MGLYLYALEFTCVLRSMRFGTWVEDLAFGCAGPWQDSISFVWLLLGGWGDGLATYLDMH